jgi:hypothetical protein
MIKNKISILLTLSFVLSYLTIFAQGSAIPLGNDAYHIIDRLEIKTGTPVPFITGMKPYLRGDVIRYALMIDSSNYALSQKDRLDLYWLFKDNNEWLAQAESAKTLAQRGHSGKTQMEMSFESDKYIERKPILKYFYKTPANGFELNKKYVHLRINPILNFKVFKDQHDDQWQFINLRGAEIRGGIDDKVYFYTNIEETQARFAPYVTERIERDRAILGAHLYKPYNSTVIKNLRNGYDFAISNAYLGFNVTRHIGMQFGHGNNFIGDGYRSLVLSNNAANYLYWKINTRFRKFAYQNIFAQMTSGNSEQDTLRRKYLVSHVLTWKPIKNLDLSAFESIMIRPRGSDQFDFNYLNPIIFYRTVEYISGSNDNAMLGLQIKYNFLKRFSFYGQLFLDEFNMGKLLNSKANEKGWWGNKYAFQTGLKYIDVFGINHLDAKIEHNFIRPYTYFHYSETAYWNSRQPLAHPVGANLKETILHLRYQPAHRLVIDTRLIHLNTGEDSTLTRPYGQNVLAPYYKHPNEYGNFVGQGIATKIWMAGVDLSYQFMHNMYAELHYFYRRKNSALDNLDQNTHYIGGGIRANIANRRNEW